MRKDVASSAINPKLCITSRSLHMLLWKHYLSSLHLLFCQELTQGSTLLALQLFSLTQVPCPSQPLDSGANSSQRASEHHSVIRSSSGQGKGSWLPIQHSQCLALNSHLGFHNVVSSLKTGGVDFIHLCIHSSQHNTGSQGVCLTTEYIFEKQWQVSLLQIFFLCPFVAFASWLELEFKNRVLPFPPPPINLYPRKLLLAPPLPKQSSYVLTTKSFLPKKKKLGKKYNGGCLRQALS